MTLWGAEARPVVGELPDEEPARTRPEPVPTFEKCGACGADAATDCFWDMGDGWTCGACFGSDSGD